MRKTQFSLICFLLGYLFSFAETTPIFIQYDKACMDKYDYVQSKKTPQGSQDIHRATYVVKINENEKVVFHTAPKGKLEKTRPANTKFCGDVLVSEAFARQINEEKNTVKLVLKTTNGFRVLPITSADYFYTTDADMGYAAKDFSYAFNYKASAKKNLAGADYKGKVYFTERDDNFCPSKYTFRRIPPKNYEPYADLVLVPDVGLVSQKVGLDAADANNNILILKSINGIPLVQYMDAVCNGYVDYLSKDKEVATTDTKKTNTTKANPNPTTVTDLEGGVTSTDITHHSNNDICNHLYKDLDKGFYYDKNTGKLADGVCGGVRYHNGMMVNGAMPSAPSTTPVKTTTTEIVKTEPQTKVIYKEAPPKVVYKETPPKVVYKDRVVYVEKPQEELVSKGATTSMGVTYHTVQIKETLYSISKKYNVTVAQIKQWNGLRDNLISPGQLVRIAPNETLTSKGANLKVGDTVPGTTTVKTETLETATNSEYHIVKPKETLYSISKKYGLTVERLKAINNMKTNKLSIGQRLNLTYVTPTSYNNNTVTIPTEYSAPTKPTKTLEKVESKRTTPLKTTKKDVLTEKGGNTTIVTGKTTLVKDALIGNTDATPETSNTDPLSVYDTNHKVHIVGNNETLYTIAKWYGTTVAKLRELNNFGKNEVILPNQKVRVQ